MSRTSDLAHQFRVTAAADAAGVDDFDFILVPDAIAQHAPPLLARFSGVGVSLATVGAFAAFDFFASSAARVGATNKVSASAKPQAASMRRQRSEDDSVEIVIKLNIDMVPTNLSSNLDWPGCRAVRQLYHTRVFVLGK